MHSQDAHEVIVIGAGFGGIGAVVALRRAGIRDVVVLEKADGVGGVWRDNTYPGAACDVKSHLYSFSFAPKPDWSRTYAPQPEILAYLQDVARTHGVLEHCRFGDEVTTATWDDDRGVWRVVTAAGREYTAPILISGVGQLSRPRIPAIPGLAAFTGDVFHSARWRHDVDLTGRRVAVVGSGASAIQFVPEVARIAGHTTVFQRSAPWILPKGDRAYPEWRKTAYGAVPVLQRAQRAWIYWTNELRVFAFNSADSRLGRATEAVVRRHIRRHVTERALAERLVPQDPIGCKRVLISNDWYPTLDRGDVTVVHSGVSRVEPRAVVADDGTVVESDVILLATGFRTTEFLAPIEFVGRDGRRLHDVWADGAEAYLGTAVHGFPNLFTLYGPNTNLGHNSIVAMIEAQLGYVTRALTHLRDAGGGSLEVREEVQASYNRRLQDEIADSVWSAGCESWYKTASGKITNNWPGTASRFRHATRNFDPAEYVMRPSPVRRDRTRVPA